MSDRKLFHSQTEYIIWLFLFINLYDKQGFSVLNVLIKTVENRNHLFINILQIVGDLFKAWRLLSKLLNFLPKLRPGALTTSLLIWRKKMCIESFYFKNGLTYGSKNSKCQLQASTYLLCIGSKWPVEKFEKQYEQRWQRVHIKLYRKVDLTNKALWKAKWLGGSFCFHYWNIWNFKLTTSLLPL